MSHRGLERRTGKAGLDHLHEEATYNGVGYSILVDFMPCCKWEWDCRCCRADLGVELNFTCIVAVWKLNELLLVGRSWLRERTIQEVA